MFTKAFTIAGLASAASAHMLMANPVPYGLSTLSNGPLEADGSNYPCKMRTGAFEAEGASNVYAQGSKQQLSFKGTAVHGGGSCQISITTDLEPTKDSKFKVIKSIEGGCPARDQAGNMGDDANADDPYTYDYTIPKDLAAGNYTIAWTWFNKVGNREMYMNCAPLTVTGSGGSESALDALPDIFVANIGDDCGTQDSTDVQFPNPGDDVDKFNGSTDDFATPTGPACAAATGGGSGGASTTQAAAPTTTAAPGTTSKGGAATSVPGGVFITVSDTPATTEAPAATSAAPVVSTPVASDPPAATTSTPSSGSGDGSGFSAGDACSTEGEWNCIGGTSFQRCASGAWTEPQELSSGVSCTPGQSSDLTMASKRAKVHMRRAHRVRA
ncbi:chitin-binding, domain 3 [Thelonectria olida]|uniref:Chitin-binding, domain 3 n=1 Tax=Thelonectria olida TaxID=1576542 RepID=A0A9P8W843_9HYPO|nr:chitin-binding, domain 3 [Thelonectria olida]